MFEEQGFEEEHRYALAEIINIAFGAAIAPVSDVLRQYVKMGCPRAECLPITKLHTRLHELSGETPVHVVRQGFSQHIHGEGMLVIPQAGGDSLARLLASTNAETDMARYCEVILEIGSTLIGVTIDKLSALLSTRTAFSPPQLSLFNGKITELEIDGVERLAGVILIHTSFQAENASEISGYLLMLLTEASVRWVVEAIDNFLQAV